MADASSPPTAATLLQPVLARCLAHGMRIVSNFGAANPAGFRFIPAPQAR